MKDEMIIKRKPVAIALVVIWLVCGTANAMGFWPNLKGVFQIINELVFPAFYYYASGRGIRI